VHFDINLQPLRPRLDWDLCRLYLNEEKPAGLADQLYRKVCDWPLVAQRGRPEQRLRAVQLCDSELEYGLPAVAKGVGINPRRQFTCSQAW